MVVLGHLADGTVWGLLELAGPAMVILLAVQTKGRKARLLMYGAALALLAVITPPLADLAAKTVTWHMVQHLVILLVAAPALGVAVSTGRRRTGRRFRRLLGIFVLPGHAPLTAGVAHLAVMAGWHVPALYDAAVAGPFVHGLEHVTMLVSGVWWWAALTHHVIRRRAGAAMLAMFGVSVGGAVVGALMMFAPEPLYSLGDVADQQLAGALMSGAMGASVAVAASATLARLLSREPARRLGIGRTGALLVVAVIAGWVAAAEPAAAAEDQPSTGEELYRRDCVSCHGPAGEGTWRGPSLAESGEAGLFYYLHTGRMPIAHPEQPVRRSDPFYTEEEIERLLEHTLRLTEGPALPDLGDVEPNVSDGGRIFRIDCAGCHGASGNGGALAIEGFAPPVHPATPGEVAAAMVAGPGTMPSFSAVHGSQEIADVAAYAATLQDLPTTGLAIPAGRMGEGLVGGLVIAVLVVVARWIGRTG